MVVTIRDVAREAGVSISTVSRALAAPERVAERTRMRVQQVSSRLGYRPNRNARSLITGRTGAIGLVVPDLENPFFGSVCKGVAARARAGGYSVFVADTDEDPALESDVIRGLVRQVDGTILCSPRTSDEEIHRLLRGTPHVLANRCLPGVPSVTFDNEAGMRALLGHLVALGHRRIAYAAGPEGSWSDRQRFEEFDRFGAEDAGRRLVSLGHMPPTFSGGVQAGDLALAADVTAIVAYNDLMALGILDRLRERGCRVPDDMSVTGFDNVAVSTFAWPSLTTVTLPRVRLGSTSVDLLLDLVSGQDAGEPVLRQIPVELVVRRSSGVVPHSSGAEEVAP